MNGIAVFVGHSFDEADSILVRAFTDFFETLKSSQIIDSWDHAEVAQAADVCQKVIEKMNGKSVFIGICTRKERAINNHKLSTWKAPLRLFGKASDFEWKTSDWVLQELGYSLGLGMKPILLVEDGVREIKGLHGNLEYVTFNRENPSQSFKKIIQQLSSIGNRQISIEQLGEPAKSAEAEDTKSIDKRTDCVDYKNPNIDWKYDDFYWAMHLAIWDKDIDRENVINEMHIKILCSDPTQLLRWKGEYLYLKQQWKNEPALEGLENLLRTNPENAYLHGSLAKALEAFKSYGKAYDEYARALVVNGKWNVQYLEKTVACLVESKGKDAAKLFLETNFENIAKEEMGGLEYMKTYSSLVKDEYPYIYCALLEAALNIKPDNSSLRFDLAYKYSEIKLKELSLFHYRVLTEAYPNEGNWNNLGVEYENNNLPISAIRSYRKSEKLNGTLAMSNIAYKLLYAGFETEARELCNEAFKIENYDKRIPAALNSINEKIEAESKAIEKIGDRIKPDQEYFVNFATFLAMPLIKDMAGKCKSQDCELDFSISNGKFSATGAYEKESMGLGLLSMMNPYASSADAAAPRIVSYRIKYQGIVSGNAGTFKVIRENESKDGAATTLLGPNQTAQDGMFYIDVSNSEFVLVEILGDGQPLKSYTMKIVSPLH